MAHGGWRELGIHCDSRSESHDEALVSSRPQIMGSSWRAGGPESSLRAGWMVAHLYFHDFMNRRTAVRRAGEWNGQQ